MSVNGGEFLALLVIAVVVVGPTRLPGYAAQLGRWVRTMRVFVADAKDRVRDELGDDADDVDWASLDPRRYDPRRIVREALLEPLDVPAARGGPTRATAPARPGEPAPFDDEAT